MKIEFVECCELKMYDVTDDAPYQYHNNRWFNPGEQYDIYIDDQVPLRLGRDGSVDAVLVCTEYNPPRKFAVTIPMKVFVVIDEY